MFVYLEGILYIPCMGSSELDRQHGFFQFCSKRLFVEIGIMHVANTQNRLTNCVLLNCGKPTVF